MTKQKKFITCDGNQAAAHISYMFSEVAAIYPVKVDEQDVLETFFANTMWKDHKVNKGDKNISFMVDEVMPFKICQEGMRIKNNPGVTYALHKAEIGRGNQIPLWLFGFLY